MAGRRPGDRWRAHSRRSRGGRGDMENSDFFIGIAHQALYITALATAPILIPALLAGVVLGMIQAATSITEATLSFVPTLIIVAVLLALFGGQIMLLDRKVVVSGKRVYVRL